MTPAQFKTARKALGMTQAQIAGFLGVRNTSTIRRWEHGQVPIPHSVNLLLRWIVWDVCPDVPGYDWPEVPE